MSRSLVYPCRMLVPLAALAGSLVALAPPATAQVGTGTVRGTVTRLSDGSRVAGVVVLVRGTAISSVTGADGGYTLLRVPEGQQTILFRWLGYRQHEETVTVTAGGTTTLDAALEPQPVTLGEIVVETPSRAPERVVEAPAAVSVIDPGVARDMAVTGQAPLALATVPGVDVVQSGVNDFNVNARGFNSSLTRRVLVMQDGRDLAVAFLGSQEWNGLAIPLDDMERIEMVRGPGSALYGANAFSGVVHMSTAPAREIAGTKLTLAGGELSTFRGDIRHAGLLGGGRWGYRVNAGYYRSDTWSRSRTARDTSDFKAEYGEATDSVVRPPTPGFELRALNGQTVDATTGRALGDRDDLVNMYGSARFDYYADNGSLVTAEGGVAQVENEVLVTGIGRVQITKALKPWARVNWAHRNYNVMAWYSGRRSTDPQFSLGTGLPIEEKSDILHVEGQYNRAFAADRARVVLGASARQYKLDTEATLMLPADDQRTDNYYSAYGQLEYKLLPQVKAVAAARWDEGDLFSGQFSPKGALVFTPNDQHSVRFTVNRAFQTPNYSEFFVRLAGSVTTSPATLEKTLEGYFATIRQNFGADPTLPATPTNLPWNFADTTRAFALGNRNLDVETVTGWEIGYKGSLSPRVYVGADLYFNRLTDFVTDLLPAVNAAMYPLYALTDQGTNVPATLVALDAYLASKGLPLAHPLRAAIPQLQAGYAGLNAQLVQTGLLATLPDGQRAIVVSYTNAGNVTERGVELSAGAVLTDEIRVDGSFTYFDFDEPEGAVPGDVLLPNTPKRKGTVSVSYRGAQGLDLGASARLVSGYEWAAGIYRGFIEPSETINVSAGYRINNYLRVHALATNVFDQKRFHMYGGSVIGRRVIGGVTATF